VTECIVLQEDEGAKDGAEPVVLVADSLEAVDAGQPGEGSGDIFDLSLPQGHPCQNLAFRSIRRALGTKGCEQPAPVQVKRTLFTV